MKLNTRRCKSYHARDLGNRLGTAVRGKIMDSESDRARLEELLSEWDAATVKPTPEQLCRDAPTLLPDVQAAVKRLQAADRQMETKDPSGEIVQENAEAHGFPKVEG